MEAKHTPGSWKVRPTDDYGSYFIHEAAVEQNSWVDAGYDESEEEGERRNAIAEEHDKGNAHLIAAAPDLLAALEKIDQTAEGALNKTGLSPALALRAVVDIAVTAINQAKGAPC